MRLRTVSGELGGLRGGQEGSDALLAWLTVSSDSGGSAREASLAERGMSDGTRELTARRGDAVVGGSTKYM